MTTAAALRRVLGVLHDCLVVCRDGEAGYRHAAARMDDEDLGAAFTRRANERAAFAGELEGALDAHGGAHPSAAWYAVAFGAAGGSAAASLHRRWLSARAFAGDGDILTVVAECARGERAALATYERALVRPELPATVVPMLESHWGRIFEAHGRLEQLARAPASLLRPAAREAWEGGHARVAWGRLVDRRRFWEAKLEIEGCACRAPHDLGAVLDRYGLESLAHWRMVQAEVLRCCGRDPAMSAVARRVSHARILELHEADIAPRRRSTHRGA